MSLGVLFTTGGYLWTIDKQRRLGDLGQGILVGVVVSLALLIVQRDADEKLRKISDQQERQSRAADLRREEAQTKQNLRLQLSRERGLSGLSLERTDLADLVLAGKDVTAARFDHAHLDRVDFEHAILRRVSAKHAQFRATWLEDADLRGAQLDDANLDGANLEGADLRHVSAVGAKFTDAWMTRADLRGGQFFHATEPPAFDLGRALVTSPDRPRKASFVRAQMRAAVLSGLELTKVEFRDARLRRANLRGAQLSAADFRGAILDKADLREADLNGATLCKTSLDGARLVGATYNSTTRWPKGVDPEARGALLEDVTEDVTLDEDVVLPDAGSPYPRC